VQTIPFVDLRQPVRPGPTPAEPIFREPMLTSTDVVADDRPAPFGTGTKLSGAIGGSVTTKDADRKPAVCEAA
jgi:hypothetical protein